MNIFVAGATGVIGRRLVPLLLGAGHALTGTTRTAAKAAGLAALGVNPVVVDVFDAEALTAAMVAAQPRVVIHQLTDLPAIADPAALAAALTRNARLRIVGTPNLMAAARAAGATRVIAQSVAFAYAPGPAPLDETAPLDLAAEGSRAETVRGVAALEHAVTSDSRIEGIVLRYGRLYGPGTWFATPQSPPLHVDAAAHAALLAIDRGTGIYNIAEDDGAVAIGRARADLGFDPAFRLPT